MKKSLMKIAGALLAAAALFFVSCSDTVTPKYDSKIDTVLTLDKPSITVTAYPGMNYVSWTSVTGATSYYLSIYEDGVERYSYGGITRTYAQNFYVDTTIQDGHSYKYRVEAISKSNPAGSRAVVVSNSAAESKEVKAIVPIAGTEAIAFTELDTSKNSKDFVVTSAGINAQTSLGYIRMSFPTKAYLKYVPYVKSSRYLNATESNQESGATLVSSSEYYTASTIFNPSANNVNPTNAALNITTPGTYKLGLKVYSALGNSNIYPMSDIIAEKEIVIPGIRTSVATGNVAYKWISSDKARLYWTPATLADGTVAKAANYVVYTYDSADYRLEKVTGAVAESADGFDYIDVTPAEDTTYVVAYTVVGADETISVESRTTANKVTVNVAATPVAAAPVSADVSMVADDDGIANDAVLSIQLAADTKLKAVKYAVTDSNTTYAALLDSDYTSVDFTADDIYYEIPVATDVEEGKYVTVKYTISAEGYEDYVGYKVSSTASGEPSAVAAAPTASISVIAADDDGKQNDVKVIIKLADDTALTSVVYTTSDVSAAKARLLLNNPSAVKTVTFDAGYAYNVLTISDVEDGNYVAVKAIVSADACKDKVVTLATTTAIDTSATTTGITLLSANFVDADDDGNANDYVLRFAYNGNQELKEMLYATSAISGTEAVNLTYSKAAVAVQGIVPEADFGKDYGAIYVAVIKDVPAGEYVGIRYTLAEEGKTSYSGEITGLTTSGIKIITDTADPVISISAISFNAEDKDANYNDATDTFTVEIGFNQKISSIYYAIAEDKDYATAYASIIKDKVAVEIPVPNKYELKTTASNPTVLTKVYTIDPKVKNVTDGNYISYVITISEEGYNDVVKVIESAKPAAQKAVTLPSVTIGDIYNYEYVDVLVTDGYVNDKTENYEYSIEWTTEKEYEEGNPVWVTLEGDASKVFNIVENDKDGNFVAYRYAKRYPVLALGNYVIRVTKTRKASAAISGKAESVFKDSRFTVVDIPCRDLTSYYVNGNYEFVTVSASETIYTDYENLNLYTYTLYECEIFDNPETTDKNELTDFTSLSTDDQIIYLQNEEVWKKSVAVNWEEDAYYSEYYSAINKAAGARNPNVKYYTFNKKFVKETPGLYYYLLIKERTTPAKNSTTELKAEVMKFDDVNRIPNEPVSDFAITTANYQEVSVTFKDKYYTTYDDVDNWKYEIQYMLDSAYDPSVTDLWADTSKVTTVTVTPSSTYNIGNDFYGRSYKEYSFGKTLTLTPNQYKTRLVKTRKAAFVAADDSEKYEISSVQNVNVYYLPTASASVAAGDFFEFTVNVEDKFNTSYDASTNWTYELVYYKASDAEAVAAETIVPSKKTIYLGYKGIDSGIETDEVESSITVPVTENTDYVVELYKVPAGYTRSAANLIKTNTVTVKYDCVLNLNATVSPNKIVYSVTDYAEDMSSNSYKLAYYKTSDAAGVANGTVTPDDFGPSLSPNYTTRLYEANGTISLTPLTEDTSFTVVLYKNDKVVKTTAVTVLYQ